MRVSGGHLCEAEAPTEPAGETAVRRVAIRFPIPSVIAKPCKRLWQSVLLFKGNTDSFALRAQNDTPFSYCKSRKVRGGPLHFITVKKTGESLFFCI